MGGSSRQISSFRAERQMLFGAGAPVFHVSFPKIEELLEVLTFLLFK